MLNEYEAWMYLFNAWSKPLQMKEEHEVGILIKEEECHCLCWAIKVMRAEKMVEVKTEESMMTKIDAKVKSSNFLSYLAPCTREGAKVRADFCRNEAINLKK